MGSSAGVAKHFAASRCPRLVAACVDRRGKDPCLIHTSVTTQIAKLESQHVRMRPPGGPCDHCGRISSPCWRKGPPEKPLLCNACGARYLVKKNLDGYMPGSKPSRRDSVSSSGRGNGLAAIFVNRPGSEHKRKRKLSKRYALRLHRSVTADCSTQV